MVLKLPYCQKCPEHFEMAFFNFLEIFEWRNWNCFLGKWGKAMKSKLFFGKVRQSNQNCLNSKLATKSILHNSFEATLRSKRNTVSIWKWSFWSFCKFLGDEVETVFWESEAKHWRLLKSKVSHRKHFRNLFWSYLEVKNQCPGLLEKAFFTFLKFLNDEVWSRLLEKRGKMLKTF